MVSASPLPQGATSGEWPYVGHRLYIRCPSCLSFATNLPERHKHGLQPTDNTHQALAGWVFSLGLRG